MGEGLREVVARHTGECGRFGLPCAETKPRNEWCGRCDLNDCLTADLLAWVDARLGEAREGVVEAIADADAAEWDIDYAADAALGVVRGVLGLEVER